MSEVLDLDMDAEIDEHDLNDAASRTYRRAGCYAIERIKCRDEERAHEEAAAFAEWAGEVRYDAIALDGEDIDTEWDGARMAEMWKTYLSFRKA